MLDLSTFTNNYYEIKLIDGTVLQLARPTQALQETLLKIKELSAQMQEGEAINWTMETVVRVLNRNVNDRTFTLEDLDKEGIDLSIGLLIIKDYFTYWNDEVLQKVDFPKAQ